MPGPPPEQHPVGQACVELHVKVQIPAAHPWAPAPQSLTVVQPHWPPWLTGSQTCPWVLEPQALHAPPLWPQSSTAVPATQVPPAQQPPLQGWVAGSHWEVQRCVAASHAVCAGQSATDVQPQNVEAPLVTHRPPFALAAQLTHAGAALVAAQDVLVTPCVHVVPSQQPPLQATFAEHDVEQACVTGSHA